MTAASRLEGNVPWIWARYPPAVRGVQLPVTFSYSSPSNDCEFLIDVAGDRQLDIFPSYRIVEVAGDLVHYCLLGRGPEASTIGNDTVGPRRVVNVTLRKKIASVNAEGNSVKRTESYISGTNVLLTEDGSEEIID